jgi:hypothetical protein
MASTPRPTHGQTGLAAPPPPHPRPAAHPEQPRGGADALPLRLHARVLAGPAQRPARQPAAARRWHTPARSLLRRRQRRGRGGRGEHAAQLRRHVGPRRQAREVQEERQQLVAGQRAAALARGGGGGDGAAARGGGGVSEVAALVLACAGGGGAGGRGKGVRKGAERPQAADMTALGGARVATARPVSHRQRQPAPPSHTGVPGCQAPPHPPVSPAAPPRRAPLRPSPPPHPTAPPPRPPPRAPPHPTRRSRARWSAAATPRPWRRVCRRAWARARRAA